MLENYACEAVCTHGAGVMSSGEAQNVIAPVNSFLL
jgi:hypothetical protein